MSTPVVHAWFAIERDYPVAPGRVFPAFADEATERHWFVDANGFEVHRVPTANDPVPRRVGDARKWSDLRSRRNGTRAWPGPPHASFRGGTVGSPERVEPGCSFLPGTAVRGTIPQGTKCAAMFRRGTVVGHLRPRKPGIVEDRGEAGAAAAGP